jgi:hypothetical protein
LFLLITFLQEGSATSFNESLASSCHPADDVSTYGFGFGVVFSTVGFGHFAVVWFGALIWIYASNVPMLPPFGFSFPQRLHKPHKPPFQQVLCSHFRFRVWFAMAIFLLLCSGVGAGAPLAPESAAEDARATSIHLAADRVLRSQTRQSHGQLVEQFQTWLFFEHGISWNDLFGKKPWDPELFGWWLWLHGSGKSYTRYSETINAVVGLRSILKRQLTGAWDLAFAWLIDEPHQHHPALPVRTMLSLVGIALMWGWPVEAAIIALTWTGALIEDWRGLRGCSKRSGSSFRTTLEANCSPASICPESDQYRLG